MIPLGYMLKTVEGMPEKLAIPGVELVYSLSSHISENFADYIPEWKHNGWGLFDSPAAVMETAARKGVALDGLTLFYYEAFASEYDEDDKTWYPIAPKPEFRTAVTVPAAKTLHGYDVVAYTSGWFPECSPLSCNAVAKDVQTNRFCLLDDIDAARADLEAGVFDNSEPGPFRLVAVYTV